MFFLKLLLRSILTIIFLPITITAIAIGVLPATTAFVNFISGIVPFVADFWWLNLALGGAIGLVAILVLKMLPIRNNGLRFFTETALLGVMVAGLAYIGVTKIGGGMSVIHPYPYGLVNGVAPWLAPILANNTYIALVGGGLLLVALLFSAIIRRVFRLRKTDAQRLETISKSSKEDRAASRNVVSSAAVDTFDLASVKPKKYVKDIYGHYIEEDEYNARINRARNTQI